jgi:hypothetical protein
MILTSLKVALDIFLKYETDDSIAAEHDELYACDIPPAKMDPQDVICLEEEGWSWSESYDCWRHFT